jgi:hypothetical protein
VGGFDTLDWYAGWVWGICIGGGWFMQGGRVGYSGCAGCATQGGWVGKSGLVGVICRMCGRAKYRVGEWDKLDE